MICRWSGDSPLNSLINLSLQSGVSVNLSFRRGWALKKPNGARISLVESEPILKRTNERKNQNKNYITRIKINRENSVWLSPFSLSALCRSLPLISILVQWYYHYGSLCVVCCALSSVCILMRPRQRALMVGALLEWPHRLPHRLPYRVPA